MDLLQAVEAILEKHQVKGHGLTHDSPDTCLCGVKIYPAEPWTEWESSDSRRNRAMARHQVAVIKLATN